MKTLIAIILIPLLLLAVLRAELTPWRLVSPSEYASIQSRLKSLEQQVLQAQQAQQVAQTQRPKLTDGSWMRDEKYRTSLEKSTVIGVPEASKRRDH